MPGQQNGLRVVPCSQPDPLEPPGTTAPVRGVIVLLGVYCCFHGLECGCEKEPRGADFARECEVRALVLRPQAASRRVLASHFPLGPLAHIGRLAGTPSPRLCGGDASPGCTQIAAERHIAPCAPTVASLPPPLLRTLHQCVSAGRMPRRQPRCSLLGSFASPAKSSSEATAVWALHQPSSPFEDGIGVARGICADRELRRRSCATGRAKRSPSDRLPLYKPARTVCAPLLGVHLSEVVCDDNLYPCRSESHTHLNHTHI